MLFALPGHFLYSPNLSTRSVPAIDPPLAANFTMIPGFILKGDVVNFTETVTGGVTPYRINWTSSDGASAINVPIFLHKYLIPNSYTMRLNVTDSVGTKSSITKTFLVNDWPLVKMGWVVPWNLTADDGVNIWNVTYHGKSVIEDARLTASQVLYLHDFCGPFFDEPFNMTGVKEDGDISYNLNASAPDPYFELTAEWRVGGYDYTETFRFYQDARWEPVLTIGRDGCPVDHIYEPHWRIALALNENSNNYMSMYTSQGGWQDLLWEGNYTDNGFRDATHYSTVWRYGDQGRFYYIVPKIVRYDLDLPNLPSDLILVRDHPNEFEVAHGETGHVESPVEWVNGEFAFRRDIAFWFVPKVYDHGPIPNLTLSLKVVTLTFYPSGAWT
jgi:hypothetical protein